MSVDREPIRPIADRYSEFFWDGARAHQLVILRCDACGFYIHWPRPVCKRCGSFALTPAAVSGRGILYTFTIAEQAFAPWFEDRLPYVLAVVQLVEQDNLKLVSNVIDCAAEDVRCDMAVEVTFREVADGLTLPLFRPSTAVPA